MKPLKRREFIKTGLVAGSAALLANKLQGSAIFSQGKNAYCLPAPGEVPDIVTISADNLETGIPKLLDALGGIKSFVKPGQVVGMLVNSPWKNPGYYTQPDVVIIMADLCFKAGAKDIIFFKPVHQVYWERGKLYSKYKPVIDRFKNGTDDIEADIPKGKSLKKAEIVKEFKNVDVFISIPVAKHHAGCMFSGNLKGMMGVSSSTTNRYMHSPDGEYTYDNHEYLAQCIADLNLIRKPDLCLVDAIECSINNGPAGPGETVKPNKLIAGLDPLALDVYAASLIGFYTEDILTFKRASENGIGEIDPGKLTLMEL